MHRQAVLAAVLLTACAQPAAPPGVISGTFALENAAQRTRAYLQGNAVWFAPLRSSAPIRHYDLDMTKYLHAIIIGDDFKMFLHVHPVLKGNGKFVFLQSLPRGVYHLYADAMPSGFGQQVFRFDVGQGHAPHRDLSESSSRAIAGPYIVLLRGRLKPATDTNLVVRITRNGKPASDLHPYLGALAHAVFISARTLSYLHVHPMPYVPGAVPMPAGMPMQTLPESSRSSPAMTLDAKVAQAGLYKLWLQFRGGSSLYVAPFVLRAR